MKFSLLTGVTHQFWLQSLPSHPHRSRPKNMGGSGRVIEQKLIATVRRESAVVAAAMATVPENSYIFPALERSRHGLRNHQRHAGYAAHWRRGRRLDARQAAQQPPGRGVAPGAAEHQVLFFRDQPLDVEGHKAFGRYFGDLHIHPNTPGPEGHPEILPIHADANSKRIAGEYWHSDVSCDEKPPLGSILYLHTVPPVGGDTLFASQYAAYDALSPRMKAYLEGLTATHSGEHLYRATNVLVGRDDRGKVFPKASHPIIRTHPVTKRKALFVNQGFTTHIDE